MRVFPGVEGYIMLAIFDGHGGDGAAIYAEANLIRFVQETGNEYYVS